MIALLLALQIAVAASTPFGSLPTIRGGGFT
jgi:hypothetical protein